MIKLLVNFGKKLVALSIIFAFFSTIAAILYLIVSNIDKTMGPILILIPVAVSIIMLDRFTSFRGPIRVFANRTFLFLYNTLIYRRRFLWEQLYDMLCILLPSTQWKHMNWGYASMAADGKMNIPLDAKDENERFSIQLYHHVSTSLGTHRTLEGKTLMEVSSGRGGGVDYISRYLNPKKCIGVDISQVQVDYCNKIYKSNPKLQFVNGDSMALSKNEELKKEKIDIVINVESGHCYPSFKKFIEEVEKVLPTGGIFAYSDFRPTHEWPGVEDELRSLKNMEISENVMQSLKLDEDRKWQMIKNEMGPVLRFFFKQIGGVKGSHIFEGLSKKQMRSMAYVLEKV